MASPPMNPRPPGAVQAQRPTGKILLIVGLVLAVIIAASVFAIYIGIRILSHNVSVREVQGANGTKEVSIRTPVGNVEIHKGAEASLQLLGLPAYPGARRVTDNDNASVTANFAGQNLVGVLAAKFETDDPIQKVRRFYQTELSGRVTRYIEKDSEGKTVLEVKTAGQEKIVALQKQNGGTRIELVKIVAGRSESN
jgi:hypothetical protein